MTQLLSKLPSWLKLPFTPICSHLLRLVCSLPYAPQPLFQTRIESVLGAWKQFQLNYHATKQARFRYQEMDLVGGDVTHSHFQAIQQGLRGPDFHHKAALRACQASDHFETFAKTAFFNQPVFVQCPPPKLKIPRPLNN